MSAPADIISRKRSITRPANAAAVWFKKYFIKLYVALDKTQRERAAEIIHRYEYLTSKRDELPGEKNGFSVQGTRLRTHQFWPVSASNHKSRRTKS